MSRKITFKKSKARFTWFFVVLFFALWILPQAAQARFKYSFHVGATYPLSMGTDLFDKELPDGKGLKGIADSNIHFRFNIDYNLTDKVNLVAFWGFSQFTDDYFTLVHYYWYNFSVNCKPFFFTKPCSKWYVQCGPGWYIPKPGLLPPHPEKATIGGNLGFGSQIPIKDHCKLEWGVDMHCTNFFNDDEPKYWFLTLQLGVLFR